jgi:hypothetical protein
MARTLESAWVLLYSISVAALRNPHDGSARTKEHSARPPPSRPARHPRDEGRSPVAAVNPAPTDPRREDPATQTVHRFAGRGPNVG